MKPHKCPVCAGAGWCPPIGNSTDSLVDCTACNGTGIVWEQENNTVIVCNPQPTPVDFYRRTTGCANGKSKGSYEF